MSVRPDMGTGPDLSTVDIILILSLPVFAFLLSREATNTNFIVFDLTRPGLECMIYRTQGEHTNQFITNVGPDLSTVRFLDTYLRPGVSKVSLLFLFLP